MIHIKHSLYYYYFNLKVKLINKTRSFRTVMDNIWYNALQFVGCYYNATCFLRQIRKVNLRQPTGLIKGLPDISN